MKQVVLALIVGLSMTGCASILSPYENGTYVSEQQIEQVKVGKSKEADVVRLFGHPTSKEQLKKKEVWSYPYTKISHFGANVNETTVVEFNSKGIVQNVYKTNARKGKTGNALLDAANGKS